MRFQPEEGPSRGLLRDYKKPILKPMDRFTALLLTPAAGLAPGERRSRELRAGAVIYNGADYGLRPPSR